ncbi:hypothetical protein Q31a_31280 [Aureliella helgolandensis]|uniref:Uncharacterized protein n=1 Tax=Aureliella helgolandensis TaxID=2527968 RepID=A0A518G897_9BACT|nr:hypothetical protein Q31a_31280 [Aureliella helgolandensis]
MRCSTNVGFVYLACSTLKSPHAIITNASRCLHRFQVSPARLGPCELPLAGNRWSLVIHLARKPPSGYPKFPWALVQRHQWRATEVGLRCSIVSQDRVKTSAPYRAHCQLSATCVRDQCPTQRSLKNRKDGTAGLHGNAQPEPCLRLAGKHRDYCDNVARGEGKRSESLVMRRIFEALDRVLSRRWAWYLLLFVSSL